MNYYLAFSLCVLAFMPMRAQADNHHEHQKGVAVKSVSVSDGVTMLQAGGGNIGVFSGDDGVFVIDSDLDGAGEALLAAIAEISDKPVKFLLNTHWHYDHTGSNAHFHDAADAVILSHDNVRKRLADGGRIAAFDKVVEPAPSSALPVVTYTGETTLHLNGASVRVVPVPPAHTDGDSFVVWPKKNVIHTGDIFFNGFWPFIDASSGGGIAGVIEASDRILALCDDDTKIIPGHGPLARKADLEAYREVLSVVMARAQAAKAKGLSAKDWAAEEPLKEFEAAWGDGFLNTDTFIEVVWAGLPE